MYVSYNDQIQFFIVYIREAHPEKLRQGNETGVVGNPQNLDERTILATSCVTKYKFTVPMIIDDMDGKVDADYQAKPVRVAVTDIDGKIAFYGGKGPFDFRLPPVEKVLKKLISNGGRLPPPPEPQWSKPVDGLRCGLSIDPERLILGEEVSVLLKFENTTDHAINLSHQNEGAVNNLIINNGNGQALRLEAARGPVRRRNSSRGGGSGFQSIPPGGLFETEIDGKILAASEEAGLAVGKFDAVYRFAIDNQTLNQAGAPLMEAFWTGELSSGIYKLDISLPRQEGCIDCHGQEDYHHTLEVECSNCHVGEMDDKSFNVKKEACSQCHPREGVYGRRQILGPDGEFSAASRHISDNIEDKDCLLCHDDSRHRNGVVSLIDPESEGKMPWTGSYTGFCMTCHDGKPPANVSFPAESMGSGFDKSGFMKTQNCSNCHNPHGSALPSLLKNMHSR